MADSNRSKPTSSKPTENDNNESIYKKFKYDLKSLNWDEDHLSNSNNCYCYCGEGIEYCRSMLQCSSCKQWFHTSCIRSIKINLLIGDQYFKFVCSVCNTNGEVCARIIMKWSSVVGLTLSNLTYGSEQQFFNVEKEIIPFIIENESLFKLNIPLERLSHDELVKKVETNLKENPDKFVQKGNSWALNVMFPYEDPLTFSPYSTNLSSTFAKQKSVNQIQQKGSQKKSSATSKSNKSKSDKDRMVLDGAVRKGAAVSPPHVSNKLINQISKLDKKSSTSKQSNSSSLTNSTEEPNLIDWNRKNAKRKNPNSLLKAGKQSKVKKDQDDDSDEYKNLPTLDALIPHPENFLGDNNPFHVSFDEKQEKDLQKQKEARAAAAAAINNQSKTEQSTNQDTKDGNQAEYRVVNKDSNLNKLIISRVNSINENSSNCHSTNNGRLNDKYPNDLFDGKKEVKILAQRKTNNNNNIEYMLEITEKE